MTQTQLFATLTKTQLSTFSRDEIDSFVESQSRVIADLARENQLLKNSREDLKQTTLKLDEEFITIKSKIFDPVNNKSTEPESESSLKRNKHKRKKKKIQLPSERYPEAEVIEQEIAFSEDPNCDCCEKKMSFSGMYEVCEQLTVTPAVFRVIRHKRQKYRCGSCHGSIKTVPPMPRICPGSSYSDEMIIDVSLSKYCDLIPIERYATIASRNGLMNLPPQSLIQLTHYLADFVAPVYDRIKAEVFLSRVIHGDETPHKMLEENGHTKSGKLKRWYLWGFSDNKASSYFEVRNTRSGDVASELLKDSKCEYLVSDIYSGYNKAVRETNIYRKEQGKVAIKNIYCNAHAYRKFKDLDNEDFKDICQLYKKIYRLEKIAQRRPNDKRLLKVRSKMTVLFEEIKNLCLSRVMNYSSKSDACKGMKYFLKNYTELVLFVGLAEVPIDNNPQERQMRDPVIGRKTWYGNHSLKGAKTSAILFSIVGSCKLAGINPREYFKNLVKSMLLGETIKTPKEFASL